MKKYNLKNIIEVQRKYIELKQERRDLRTKLDNFQKTFETTHNRKIRYTKDIGPIGGEFKRYKELKLEIIKFEQIITSTNKQ